MIASAGSTVREISEIMPPLARQSDRKYTYKDYLGWPADERWELIDGYAYDMTPAPSIRHQKVLGNLYVILCDHQRQKNRCFVGISPIDVVFSEKDVVQPDLIVVCNPEKIMEANIKGAPDLIVEILSPATARKDKREKKLLYEKNGVPEYVLMEPEAQYAERFLLNDQGRYGEGVVFGPADTLPLSVMGGVEVPLERVFEPAK